MLAVLKHSYKFVQYMHLDVVHHIQACILWMHVLSFFIRVAVMCMFIANILKCVHLCLKDPAPPARRTPAIIRGCVCSSGRASRATVAWRPMEAHTAAIVSFTAFPFLLRCCLVRCKFVEFSGKFWFRRRWQDLGLSLWHGLLFPSCFCSKA